MKIWIIVLSLILLSANIAFADQWHAIINADGTIHMATPNIEKFSLVDGQTAHPCTKNTERIECYIWNGTDIELKPQAEVDEINSDFETKLKVLDALEKAEDKAAAKEAIKDPTLDQKTKDKLQEIIDG